LQPYSKRKLLSFLHPEKQDLEMISTDEGREMNSSEKHWANADSLRIEILEPASKLKSESSSQLAKQDLAIVSTDEGIQMD
jgi:hypothetical protein